MHDALIIRHVAFEDLGLLADILPRFDYRPTYLEAGRDAVDNHKLQNADLLIILGGPISANDEADYPHLCQLREGVSQRLDAAGPTLGICLGAQIIARALGANVYPGRIKEIGWSTLDLTAAGHNSCLRHIDNVPVLHWHGETFDLPSGAEHLASTGVCINQAYSIGRHLLALQFHPEVTVNGLERWYIGHTMELSGTGIDIPTLRKESRQHAPALQTAANALFTEWLEQLNPA